MGYDIKDAMRDLDPADDSHWTQAGKPSLEALSEKMGERVTRAQVNEANPEFCRPAAPSSPQPISGDDGEQAPPRSSDEEPTQPNRTGRAAAKAKLDKAIAEIDAGQAKCREMLAKLADESAALDRKADEMRREFDQAFPPLTAAERYKLVTDRAHEERRRASQRAASAATMGTTRLDAALGMRRGGLGSGRPNYPFKGNG